VSRVGPREACGLRRPEPALLGAGMEPPTDETRGDRSADPTAVPRGPTLHTLARFLAPRAGPREACGLRRPEPALLGAGMEPPTNETRGDRLADPTAVPRGPTLHTLARPLAPCARSRGVWTASGLLALGTDRSAGPRAMPARVDVSGGVATPLCALARARFPIKLQGK